MTAPELPRELRDTVDAIAHALDEWLGPLSAEDTDRACKAIHATLAQRYARDLAMEVAREIGRQAARGVAERLASDLVGRHVAEEEAARLRAELKGEKDFHAETFRQREAWRAKAGQLEDVLGQIAKRPQPESYMDWKAWHKWAGEVQDLAREWAPEED